LIDAGTLSNLPGGLKSRGLRIKGDDTPIAPGEFRDVDVPSGTVRDNIMALPYKEPSQVLAGLLEKITDEGRRLGSIADMNVSDMSANSPVGTTLAILERQLKNMSAVQARVHYSMKQEFKMLKSIIRDYTPTEYSYNPIGNDRKAKQSDYDLVEVIPVSDPNSSTMAQRIMQYQAVIQLAQGAPQIYDLPQLHRQMIEVLGVKNAEKLVPIEDDMTPRDPVSENMAFLTGKPTKAFIYQDALGNELPFLEDFVIQQRDYYKDYCDVARMSGTKPWVFRDDRSSELTEYVSASIDVTDSYGDVDTAVSSALYRGPIPPTYALDSEQTGNLYLVNAER
jgi:hypothetical protein